MPFMLVRNVVRDYETWKRVFDDQMGAAGEAGLELVHLWRSVDDANDVHFLMRISDMAKAQAFVNDPESARVGERAGVIDGEIHYLESVS